jgi:uncharacterized protein YeaO (DUF488 family)
LADDSLAAFGDPGAVIDRPATMKHARAMPDDGSRTPGSTDKPRGLPRRRAMAPPHALRVKRVYAAPDEGDGLRILVDRLWPRGMARQKAQVDLWLKDVAPSDALRRQFHGRPDQWAAFNAAYGRQLAQAPARPLAESIIDKLAASAVTLLYAARDEQHNNAIALRDWLASRMGE